MHAYIHTKPRRRAEESGHTRADGGAKCAGGNTRSPLRHPICIHTGIYHTAQKDTSIYHTARTDTSMYHTAQTDTSIYHTQRRQKDTSIYHTAQTESTGGLGVRLLFRVQLFAPGFSLLSHTGASGGESGAGEDKCGCCKGAGAHGLGEVCDVTSSAFRRLAHVCRMHSPCLPLEPKLCFCLLLSFFTAQHL